MKIHPVDKILTLIILTILLIGFAFWFYWNNQFRIAEDNQTQIIKQIQPRGEAWISNVKPQGKILPAAGFIKK